MSEQKLNHTGDKYVRTIRSVFLPDDITLAAPEIPIDVYCVLEAFNVVCPARQHAIKKLLCAGIRGKGNSLRDLIEAQAAISRAIDLEKQRERCAKHDVASDNMNVNVILNNIRPYKNVLDLPK